MSTAISTTGLTKWFPRSTGYKSLFQAALGRREWVRALDGVDIQVQEGELFGLLGPNGAGKTTLIKILSTLVLPTSGTASVFDHDVVREEQRVKEMVGLISAEERSFYWRLTGRENLRFYACLYRLPPRQLGSRVEEVLALVGLSEQGDIRFQHYSTGMKQKLAIARGLLGSPRLLFVDEPTRSLDPISAQAIRKFIRERVVEAGRTVVLATHHLGEAEELCDHLAIMDRGRVIASGTMSELRRAFQKQETCHIEARNLPHDALDGLDGIHGVASWRLAAQNDGLCTLELKLLERPRALAEVIKFLVQQGADICSCTLKDTPLEEIFAMAVRGEDREEVLVP